MTISSNSLPAESLAIAIATLGCKVNQYESAGMMETLQESGFNLTPFDGPADLYIINTCTVTGKSDYQSRQLIRRAARHNPQAVILVTGCYAQVAPEQAASLPGVALVAGNAEKGNILPLVRELVKGKTPETAPGIPPMSKGGEGGRGGKFPPFAKGGEGGFGGGTKVLLSDMRRITKFTTSAVGAFPGHTRAFLKIQDGCDAFCSYCIVPHARGKSRSLTVKEAMDRVLALGKAGYRELVITGINLGAYGRDLSPKRSLLSLMRLIGEARPSLRLRLSSLEPAEITPGLLSLIRDSEIWCRHFHIPFQSGDDGILSRMGRGYDAAFFRDLVREIVAYLPDAAIGIDVMVGFPGEGEKEFFNTRQLIEELPLAYLHVFPFSPRPGTPAASQAGQVSEADKKKRALDLRQLGRRKREIFAGRFLGKELSVLLEERRDNKTGLLQGFSSHYIPVLVANADVASVNQVVRVFADEVREGKLIGRMVG